MRRGDKGVPDEQAPGVNGVRFRRHTVGGRPLRAFTYTPFRILWAASLISFISFFMVLTARGWLLQRETGDPFQVTAIHAVAMLPMLLLSGWGGVLADRFTRRTVVVMGETLNFFIMGIQTVLLFMGVQDVWPVYVLALANGSVFALYHPARNAMVPNVVKPRDISSAVILFTTIFALSQIIGPGMAGYLIKWTGESVAFLVATLLIVPAGAMALRLPSGSSNQRSAAPPGGTWKSIMEGMQYIRARPLFIGLTLLGLVGTLFALPYNSILPVFADDILNAGPQGLGLLGVAAGVGGIFGVITVAFFSGHRQLKFLLLAGGVVLGLAILFFALSTVFALSLAMVAIVGFMMQLFLTSNMALLQIASPDYIRGRVIGIRLIVMGMGPFGVILLGTGAQFIDPAYSLALFGGLTAGMVLLVAVAIPALRQAEQHMLQDPAPPPQRAPLEALEVAEGDGD